MTHMDKLRMLTVIKRNGGLEYTFVRVTKTTPENQTPTEKAYKRQNETETEFTAWATVEPARAYDIHSNTHIVSDEGGNIMTGIINVQVPVPQENTVREGDFIVTPDGRYKLVAKEFWTEYTIFEGHMK